MSLIILWLTICYCVVLITCEETDCGYPIGEPESHPHLLGGHHQPRRIDHLPHSSVNSLPLFNTTTFTTTDATPPPSSTTTVSTRRPRAYSSTTDEPIATTTTEIPLEEAEEKNKDFLVRQREKRQDEEEEEEAEMFIEKPDPCDFGQGDELTMCDWFNYFNATMKIIWKPGKGDTALWLGGPRTDHTLNTGDGGYIFFETSFHVPPGPSILPNATTMTPGTVVEESTAAGATTSAAPVVLKVPKVDYESVILGTRNITPTGPMGFCISFFYAMEGLSVDRLKVVIMDAATQENITLWESQDAYDGRWTKGEIAYTYGEVHQIWFEAVPKRRSDPARRFRGFIALDDVMFDRMEEAGDNCLGHCTFEGGFCGWTNADTGDDFNWEQGRGSMSFLTGPSRDYSSFGKDEMSGGYIFIDSSYPRRPMDRARLISPTLKATGANLPVCMKFATHMFGNGIGTLRVQQQIEGSEIPPRTIWEISGEAGNSWYTAQVQVATTEPFSLIIEATVGANSLGNIGIDNIAFRAGTCPISPQTAARNSGDCNFEEDTCGWTNPHPADMLDDFDWARQYSYGVNGPPYDHTKRKPDGYYMNLVSSSHLPQRGGSKAWLLSPKFNADAMPRCISLAYYMYERTIDPSGPSLGSLRIHVLREAQPGSNAFTLLTVWRLNNHQGHRWLVARSPIKLPDGMPVNEPYQLVIEGIWGHGRVGYVAIDDISFFDGDCNTFPDKAKAIPGECSFERDMCGWTNATGIETHKTGSTSVIGRVGSRDSLAWRLASVISRPANLQDHTYRAPTGYIFFDIFNQNSVQNPILRSVVIGPDDGEAERCLSFWFAPFGRGESSTLSVFRVAEVPPGTEADPNTPAMRSLLWRLSTRRMDTSRPDWRYAQVKVPVDSAFRIQFEGEATDGGFALDDITIYNGDCETRPPSAVIATTDV
ncbi:MAM and LDL-receptor class A domain-containing protein 1-like [Ornithodoros turicata]|uniref:MAM and LDL-receptor class A domain-containing protein 1-like n=1 Tax=Ornithodoros turicata TaxID=34597 RepID=UPI003138E3D6